MSCYYIKASPTVEGDIENYKGPQWHDLIIIPDNLPVNIMKTKVPKI